ncbi:hypothetical protein T265_04665 [Opisthorchis viverrini]|uniref:Reverse transcriptase domain-containing protein n=1 Tax=Opisthorchis viverrini TaxID=6198 RepID=A0A074ZYX2_OPIVI|nr:hypothetical protein T265_04665 [Opisthorchis viverrini]KER28530.1 hypothetical protein T265_04665 [Opisthorchis viverrini]
MTGLEKWEPDKTHTKDAKPSENDRMNEINRRPRSNMLQENYVVSNRSTEKSKNHLSTTVYQNKCKLSPDIAIVDAKRFRGSPLRITNYTLGPQPLFWTSEEKALGVRVSSCLKNSLQCTAVYKRTSQVLSLLKRIFGRFTRLALPRVINTYTRPTVEYAIQAWSPWFQKDIILLQRIYHRATKLVIGLQNKPYEDRIASLNLFDFYYRRIRGDLILTYNILKTPNHPLEDLFVRRRTRTGRRHDFSLAVPYSRVNCRRNIFAVRVCFIWTSLPPNVVHSPSLTIFKNNLDAYLMSKPNVELFNSM